MNNNLLVTSIGSYSTECVINSLRSFCEGKIYGCDIYPSEWHAVSGKFDFIYKSPLVKNEESYFNFIKHICTKDGIKIIIPLTDIDVDFFNNYREYFIEMDIVVTIGNSDFLEVARNKHNLYQFTRGCTTLKPINGYLYSELTGNEKYPLIAKPKDGRSSEGIYYLKKLSDIKINNTIDNYFFQEVISGSICTVDYVRSSTSKESYFIPRIELIRTSNGAGMTIETFYNKYLAEILDEIGNKLDINGCVNLEFILNNGNYYLIDINPRFSAGVGFSKLAGYDFVKNHLLCFIDNNIIKQTSSYKKIIAQKTMIEVINLEKC